MASVGERSQKLWGTLVRKERWGLSWRGRLIVVLLTFSVGVLIFLNLEPFLAETHRVDSHTLVVEGWVPKYAIKGAVQEFRRGTYERVFVTGGPVTGLGHYVNDYQTSAHVGAHILLHDGLPPEYLQVIPSRVIDRDRTYASALALREWFREHNIPVQSVNIVTENTHARRTRLLFQKAMGKKVAVGVIAVGNPDYDKHRWWWYSEGVKDVGSEALAYLYARLLFHPSESVPTEEPTAMSQVHR